MRRVSLSAIEILIILIIVTRIDNIVTRPGIIIVIHRPHITMGRRLFSVIAIGIHITGNIAAGTVIIIKLP